MREYRAPVRSSQALHGMPISWATYTFPLAKVSGSACAVQRGIEIERVPADGSWPPATDALAVADTAGPLAGGRKEMRRASQPRIGPVDQDQVVVGQRLPRHE